MVQTLVVAASFVLINTMALLFYTCTDIQAVDVSWNDVIPLLL